MLRFLDNKNHLDYLTARPTSKKLAYDKHHNFKIVTLAIELPLLLT